MAEPKTPVTWRILSAAIIVLIIGLVVTSPQVGLSSDQITTFLFAAVSAVALISLYFLPTVIASRREHKNSNSILVVNLFFGWTFIGWVVSLAWAVSATDRSAR